MCGIAGLYLKDPSIVATDNDRLQFDRFVDELMLGIEARGRDASGFIAANGMTIQMDKKDVKASDFIKTRRRAWMGKNGTRMVLCHTRLATQGHQSQMENNHPVMHGSTFVTHNGHIHNDDTVFDDLKLDRYAEVDSVAIAAALDHYGFDNAKAALEKLGGAFAIAAINPVENKDTLLLAKGPSYPPIRFFENKHMLVWASEAGAIQDAWKKVLGTPPLLSKIGLLDAGDVIWVRDGEVERVDDFFTPKSNYKSTGYTSSWGHNPNTFTPTTGSRTGRPVRGVTVILDLKERVTALRDAGNGRAITFDKKAKMTPAQLAMHNNKWVICRHCKDTVADMCIIEHSNYGEICWDCVSIAYAQAQANAPKKGADFANMAEEDMEQLEEYAEIDMDTVFKCTTKVSEETGLTYTLVFWLLFCSDGVNMGFDTEALKDKLMELYVEAESEHFDGSFEDKEAEACSIVDQIIPPSHQIAAGSKPEIPTVLGKCDHCRKKAKVFFMGKRWCNRHRWACATRACKDDPVAFDPEGKMTCHKHSRGIKGLRYLEKATV